MPAATLAPLKRGLSRAEAAGYIGVGATTFDRMVADGTMPPPLRIYGRVVWDLRALDEAFEALQGASGRSDDGGPEPCEWD